MTFRDAGLRRAPINFERRRLLRFAAASVVAVCLPACRNEIAGLVPGDRFPDIDLPHLDGRTQQFRTRTDVPLLVNFWATWCEPCRREMPDLERLSRLFVPDELSVIGISIDSDINLAREFALQYRLTFPLLSDNMQTLSREVLHIPVFPTTYLLKGNGAIARVYAGARDWAAPTMVEEIEGLLEIKKVRDEGVS